MNKCRVCGQEGYHFNCKPPKPLDIENRNRVYKAIIPLLLAEEKAYPEFGSSGLCNYALEALRIIFPDSPISWSEKEEYLPELDKFTKKRFDWKYYPYKWAPFNFKSRLNWIKKVIEETETQFVQNMDVLNQKPKRKG